MSEDQLSIRYGDLERLDDGRPLVATLKEDVSGRKIDDDLTLWRYLSLPKFVSLLATTSLWFSRLDMLGDPFEGAAPGSEIQLREERDDKEILDRVARAHRRWWVVSCWQAGAIESDAMWRVYSSPEEGIAIQTTVGRLRDTLERSLTQYSDVDHTQEVLLPGFFIGPVMYVVHSRTVLEDGPPFAKHFLKRLAFRHEAEVRIVAPLPELASEEGVDSEADPGIPGVYVPVDLERLITGIVVSPAAKDWYRRGVEYLVREHGFAKQLKPSAMDTVPHY